MKLIIVALLMLAAPAYALDLRDTVGEWKQASVEDRALLLKLAIERRGDAIAINRQTVMICMNQLAETRLLLPKPLIEAIEYCVTYPDSD
jgi:hypothetical protein